MQNTRNRQAENDLNNKEATSSELSTKTVKAVTQVKDATGAETRNSIEINYEQAAAEAINKVKQDLATKEVEQRLKREIEKQRLIETLCMTKPEPEIRVNSMSRSNCNTLKLLTRKPFGITKNGARIMSMITVGGHEVTRNLSEPSDQTVLHIDVYADYLSAISTQTPSRALRALISSGGSKSVRIVNRYTDAYGPHVVMWNIDGINIYTKTMITCDED